MVMVKHLVIVLEHLESLEKLMKEHLKTIDYTVYACGKRDYLLK